MVKTIKVSAEAITVVAANGGKLLSGSKDKKVAIISAVGGAFKLDKFVDLGQSYPKALDYFNGNLIAGLRNGTIVELKNVIQTEEVEPVTLMTSHFDGEAWGMELLDGGRRILTCGDDNKFMLINTTNYTVER